MDIFGENTPVVRKIIYFSQCLTYHNLAEKLI